MSSTRRTRTLVYNNCIVYGLNAIMVKVTASSETRPVIGPMPAAPHPSGWWLSLTSHGSSFPSMSENDCNSVKYSDQIYVYIKKEKFKSQ